MKKLILSAVIVLSSLSTFAQTTTNSNLEVATAEPKEAVAVEVKSETVATKIVANQKVFTPIVASEVPAEVHAALEVAHPGAVVQKAFVNEAKQYKLELKVGDKEAIVYSDAAGNWTKK